MRLQAFLRKPKMQLTYEGGLFLSYAKEAVASESNILSALKAVADEDSGSLHVGVSTPRAAIFIPEILKRFHACIPKCQRAVVGPPILSAGASADG